MLPIGVYTTFFGSYVNILITILDLYVRYDLNALFTKAFGDFSVNVQGISRVGFTSPSIISLADMLIMVGNVPLESILLGAEGC